MVKNDLILVRHYYCPFCGRVFKINRHRCWKDPRNRSCGSCIHPYKYDGNWYCDCFETSLDNVMNNHTSDIKIQKTIFDRKKIIDCVHHEATIYLEKALKEHLKLKEVANGEE